jgi:Protein of unknown function (DUF2806)
MNPTAANSKGREHMGDGHSIINLGDLTKPATVLVEKISDAIGGIFRPHQIRRVADAEAYSEKVKAVSQLEITDLQRRAMQRLFKEEARKQANMESITARALPQLEPDSRPQDVNDDWIANLFEQCRIVSDEEMQILWSKVLAGEANSPGSFSKRTVNFLGSLDKPDAEMFSTLCRFAWTIDGLLDPLIFMTSNSIDTELYTEHGLSYTLLHHFDHIGLLRFEQLATFQTKALPDATSVSYYDNIIMIEIGGYTNNRIATGNVSLSRIGRELASICGAQPISGFMDYVLGKWVSEGLNVFSPYPRRTQ